jgi:hypothetical protein
MGCRTLAVLVLAASAKLDIPFGGMRGLSAWPEEARTSIGKRNEDASITPLCPKASSHMRM